MKGLGFVILLGWFAICQVKGMEYAVSQIQPSAFDYVGGFWPLNSTIFALSKNGSEFHLVSLSVGEEKDNFLHWISLPLSSSLSSSLSSASISPPYFSKNNQFYFTTSGGQIQSIFSNSPLSSPSNLIASLPDASFALFVENGKIKVRQGTNDSGMFSEKLIVEQGEEPSYNSQFPIFFWPLSDSQFLVFHNDASYQFSFDSNSNSISWSSSFRNFPGICKKEGSLATLSSNGKPFLYCPPSSSPLFSSSASRVYSFDGVVWQLESRWDAFTNASFFFPRNGDNIWLGSNFSSSLFHSFPLPSALPYLDLIYVPDSYLSCLSLTIDGSSVFDPLHSPSSPSLSFLWSYSSSSLNFSSSSASLTLPPSSDSFTLSLVVSGTLNNSKDWNVSIFPDSSLLLYQGPSFLSLSSSFSLQENNHFASFSLQTCSSPPLSLPLSFPSNSSSFLSFPSSSAAKRSSASGQIPIVNYPTLSDLALDLSPISTFNGKSSLLKYFEAASGSLYSAKGLVSVVGESELNSSMITFLPSNSNFSSYSFFLQFDSSLPPFLYPLAFSSSSKVQVGEDIYFVAYLSFNDFLFFGDEDSSSLQFKWTSPQFSDLSDLSDSGDDSFLLYFSQDQLNSSLNYQFNCQISGSLPSSSSFSLSLSFYLSSSTPLLFSSSSLNSSFSTSSSYGIQFRSNLLPSSDLPASPLIQSSWFYFLLDSLDDDSSISSLMEENNYFVVSQGTLTSVSTLLPSNVLLFLHLEFADSTSLFYSVPSSSFPDTSGITLQVDSLSNFINQFLSSKDISTVFQLFPIYLNRIQETNAISLEDFQRVSQQLFALKSLLSLTSATPERNNYLFLLNEMYSIFSDTDATLLIQLFNFTSSDSLSLDRKSGSFAFKALNQIITASHPESNANNSLYLSQAGVVFDVMSSVLSKVISSSSSSSSLSSRVPVIYSTKFIEAFGNEYSTSSLKGKTFSVGEKGEKRASITLPNDLSGIGNVSQVQVHHYNLLFNPFLYFVPSAINYAGLFFTNVTSLSFHSLNGTEIAMNRPAADDSGAPLYRIRIPIDTRQYPEALNPRALFYCLYWSPSDQSLGNDGMFPDLSPVIDGEGYINCTSNHLTNFTVAILPVGVASGSKLNIGLIVGLVVGVSFLLVIILIVAILYVRRKSRIYKGRMREVEELMAKNASTSNFQIIKPDAIQVLHRIGGGAFGDVFKGIYLGTTEVALKKLSDGADTSEFEQEANMLQKLQHPNVTQFLGIWITYANPNAATEAERGVPEQYMVIEFMAKGSLLSVLRDVTDRPTVDGILSMCQETAAGMNYLAERGVVHRDLAARNLLVRSEGKRYVVKVADFGMSRETDDQALYASKSNKFPVKWSSPEILQYRKYSTKSDVWAFGIVMWELFEYGKIPYPEMTNAEASEKVSQGYRLPRPAPCPPEVYELMLNCWAEEPNDRPSFAELFRTLSNLLIARGNLDPRDVEAQFIPVSADADIYNNSALAPEENAYAFTDKRDTDSRASQHYNARSSVPHNVTITAGKGSEDIYSFSDNSVDKQRASVANEGIYSFGDLASGHSTVNQVGREDDIYSFGDMAAGRNSTSAPLSPPSTNPSSSFIPVNSVVVEDIYNSEALPLPQSDPKKEEKPKVDPKAESESMYTM